jgi:PAS domain S-box-containing protein
MAHANGWPALFSSAFQQSRNAMLLVNEHRRVVDANPACVQLFGRRADELRHTPVWELVVDGPLSTEGEWREQIATRRFSGEAQLRRGDGSAVLVQWGATTEIVTGRRLVLFVALNTSRWGARFRRAADGDGLPRPLSAREREIVRLVALGATGPEIADELRITHDTVRTHVRNAMEKQGARSRAHLVAKALGTDVLSD